MDRRTDRQTTCRSNNTTLCVASHSKKQTTQNTAKQNDRGLGHVHTNTRTSPGYRKYEFACIPIGAVHNTRVVYEHLQIWAVFVYSCSFFSTSEWASSVLRPLQHSIGYIRETVFTGQKTQPTVSKYWRNTYSTSITEKHNNRTINTTKTDAKRFWRQWLHHYCGARNVTFT